MLSKNWIKIQKVNKWIKKQNPKKQNKWIKIKIEIVSNIFQSCKNQFLIIMNQNQQNGKQNLLKMDENPLIMDQNPFDASLNKPDSLL